MSNWIKKLYWQGCALALAAGGLGLSWGAPLALAICLVQVAHALARQRHWRALPVQVRSAFLLLLVAGSSTPALAWAVLRLPPAPGSVAERLRIAPMQMR